VKHKAQEWCLSHSWEAHMTAVRDSSKAAVGLLVEAAPQARAGESELPRTAWIIPGVLMWSPACLSVPFDTHCCMGAM